MHFAPLRSGTVRVVSAGAIRAGATGTDDDDDDDDDGVDEAVLDVAVAVAVADDVAVAVEDGVDDARVSAAVAEGDTDARIAAASVSISSSCGSIAEILSNSHQKRVNDHTTALLQHVIQLLNALATSIHQKDQIPPLSTAKENHSNTMPNACDNYNMQYPRDLRTRRSGSFA